MSVLTRSQIEGYFQRGRLIRNPRCKSDGTFDIEADSYDLTAGTAIWKQPAVNGLEESIKTRIYDDKMAVHKQPVVTVKPGQMIFVVTYEDVIMPQHLCGTVFSRNKLALQGILALNAGHVDSGYEGPIAIRLINLRATSWTLTLGEPIFTITFQTVGNKSIESSGDARTISQQEMILRVRETANSALSNALYDLYADDVDKRLNRFRAEALVSFSDERDKTWVRRDEIWLVLLSSWWKKTSAVILFISVFAAGIAGVLYMIEFFRELLKGV